ncbi:MAG: hypothetical protein IJ523_01275 [Succinivibrionaceae bacterium]|nr:hypothetical protein [Succinivibrionaceae bacterium]
MIGLLGFGGHAWGGCKACGGGVTDRTDPDAPKKIVSRELDGLRAYFALDMSWAGMGFKKFDFELAKNDQGVLELRERGTGLALPADRALVSDVQKIIAKRGLASMNGRYRITSGLPYQFAPCGLSARYVSGESITFVVNNSPSAAWAQDLYRIFAMYALSRGSEALYPRSVVDSKATRLDYELVRNGERFRVMQAIAEEGPMIIRSVTAAKPRTVAKERAKPKSVPVSDDYFDRVSRIVESHHLAMEYAFSRDQHGRGYYGMGAEPDAGEKDSDDVFFSMYLVQDNGAVISIKTRKPSAVAALEGMINQLLEHDAQIFASERSEDGTDPSPLSDNGENDPALPSAGK